MPEFLPVSRADMAARGWEQCDFVYVIGDAYVDHPSFGHAIISRVLEAAGYKVGILSQPDWKDPKSVCALGRPRLGFLVTGGNMDSMVNHYSVSHHRRKTDAFTPGGVMGKRPDRATIVYCNLIRQSFRDVPILIGGVEASLRRLAHYDYWSDQMRRSILLDAQADLLLYGMGERSIREVADGLNSGLAIEDMTYIDGTVYRTRALDDSLPTLILPDFEALRKSPRQYAESFRIQYRNTDPFTAKRLAEPYGKEFVVQNPPQKPLTQAEMDGVYDLPYCRDYHPSYRKSGGVPAIQEVKFSLVSNRGCFGACSFCALTFHQGRIIQTRSHHSILTEAQEMTHDPDFKGYIHDVGGPTADFRAPACDKQLTKGVCPGRQCLFPSPCPNLRADHSDYLSLLRKLRKLPGVKKVFICQTWEELLHALDLVYASGYPDHMVIQEFIPGDDTYMRVMTNYSDRSGQVKLMCLGHVLLEEHSPHGIGNHAVIITEYDEALSLKIKQLLEELHYTGFSNFDIKYDSRDGKYKLFEINCRQGRSNYYVTGAGYNIAKLLVEDRIEHRELPFVITKNHALWRMVPKKVAFKFIPKAYHPQMKALIRAGASTHSLEYHRDYTPARIWRVWKTHIGNMVRFDRHNKVPEN